MDISLCHIIGGQSLLYKMIFGNEAYLDVGVNSEDLIHVFFELLVEGGQVRSRNKSVQYST